MENVILDSNLIFSAGAKIIEEKNQIYKEISNIIIQEIIKLTQCNEFVVSQIESSNNYIYEYTINISEILKYKINDEIIKGVNNYIINNNINTCYKKFDIFSYFYNNNIINIQFELENPKNLHIK